MVRKGLLITTIGGLLFTFDLPLDPPPDRWLTELSAAGATLVSLNPIRDTLEDLFVQQVTAPDVAARDRGLGAAPASRT